MKALLGTSPLTTIIGLAIAGLTVASEYLHSGETSVPTIITAVLMAILGRLVKGEDEVKSDDVKL